MSSFERAPAYATHVVRALRPDPYVKSTLRLINEEIGLLSGGEHFKPRYKWGVSMFWWSAFSRANYTKDMTPMRQALSHVLPSMQQDVEVELGRAQLYFNTTKEHVAYSVRSKTLDGENEILCDIADGLGYDVPPMNNFHLSLGSFALKNLDQYYDDQYYYQEGESDDRWPSAYAIEVANDYRAQLPDILSLDRLAVRHSLSQVPNSSYSLGTPISQTVTQ